MKSEMVENDNLIIPEDLVEELESEGIKVVLTYKTIDIGSCIEWVRHPQAGAISSFIGTTRDNHNGQKVVGLEYSCYPAMALSETRKLCITAKRDYSSTSLPSTSSCCHQTTTPTDNHVKRILVVHRLGTVPASEASILIALATPHRELGLKACQFLIDNVKSTVPIWKKELLEEGKSQWK